MFSSAPSVLRWHGVLAIVIGAVSLAWPRITIGAFVILFAVYAFVGCTVQAFLAFRSDRPGPVVEHLLLSLLSLAAGITALVWPAITAMALTVVVAAWALVTGVAELGLALRRGEIAGQRARWAFGGLVSIVLGVVLALRPDIGAVTLATVFGVFSIVYGIAALVLSMAAHRLVMAERRLLGRS